MAENSAVPGHVSDNIEAIVAVLAQAERSTPRDQRAIGALAGLLGQPRSLYALLASVSGWTGYNTWALIRHGHAIDSPPFFFLQGAIALYAAVTTTIVLVTQGRQRQEEQRNAHLELQINLLAEQRTAKIVALLEELRRDMPNVRDRWDPVAEALQQAVPPAAVSSALDDSMNRSLNDPEANSPETVKR